MPTLNMSKTLVVTCPVCHSAPRSTASVSRAKSRRLGAKRGQKIGPNVHVGVNVRVPIDPDVAAIFDPFGNAVHTALQFNCLGEDVLVTGAGPIGIMAGLVAQHAGARHVVITDLADGRLALARRCGLLHTVNPATESLGDMQRELGMREGFDIGLEMSGSGPALQQMIANMTHGGRIAMLGIPAHPIELDFSKIIFSMLTIKGIDGREIFETWYAMSALLSSRLDISGVITDRFDHTDFAQAFARAREGDSGKVIMYWNREDHV